MEVCCAAMPSETLTSIRSDAIRVPSIEVFVEPPGEAAFSVRLGVHALTVGSHPDCHVVIRDPGVSRQHCEIKFGATGVDILDLDSKNGCFLGSVAVRQATLPVGATVVVGGTRLTIRSTGNATTVAVSKAARFGAAIGASTVMRALFSRLEQAAATDETILLTGESGTGKELLARAVHERSPRRDGPFVVVDCSAIVPSLIASELFGHRRGAFTGAERDHEGAFEHAHGGTVFLDELGELPLELQPKLLRAIEMRSVQPVGSRHHVPFNARIVAATHRDLQSLVSDGHFRQDLYYRLAVLEFEVPPLRQRKDDIPLLVERFLAAMTPPKRLNDFDPNVMAMLRAHSFPGNVRELRNVVARLALFPDAPDQALGGRASPTPALTELPWREARGAAIASFERRYLEARLAEHLQNVSRTAESIGVTRQFLHRLLDKHGLSPRG